MGFFEWAALVVGAGLISAGVRAIRRRLVNTPERREGGRAVRLGWLWIGLGTLFVVAAMFDVGFLKSLFRLFLEAAN
jgi:hypothetical protein